MGSKRLAGVVVPVVTPVDDRDRVDEAAFRKVIRHVAGAGVNGIFVGGSAGEGPLLVSGEWRRMIEIAIDEASDSVFVLGGAVDTSTARVVEKVGWLRDAGYANIVVTPTFYTAVKTPDEHMRLFGAAKDACRDCELIAYNIPSCTGSEIAVETMCEMTKRGWIRYCKESSGNLDYFMRLVASGKDVGLSVFMGDEGIMAQGLLAGAVGIVPVCANYEPSTFIRAYKAGVDRNEAELNRIMERVGYLRARLPLSGVCWISGVKYAVASLGIGTGKPVSPLEPLNAEQMRKIDEIESCS